MMKIQFAPTALAILGLIQGLAVAAEPASLFPTIEEEAKNLNQFASQALDELAKLGVPTQDDIEAKFPLGKFKEFAQLVRTDAGAKLGGQGFPRLDEQLAGFELSLSNHAKLPRPLPVFSVQEPPGRAPLVAYWFTDRANLAASIPDGASEVTIVTAEGSIKVKRTEALNQLSKAILPYRNALQSETAARARDHALEVSAKWDEFFEKGRPQTLLDIMLTTYFERRHFKQPGLTGPPERQWFLLHPGAVIENIDAAPDGDQLGGAAAIELIGVNFWQGWKRIRIPFGISACALYSDRPGVKDVGLGGMLYVDNKYCLGWANHGGDNGFFVSLDLLKLIDNKKSKLESFRKNLRTASVR